MQYSQFENDFQQDIEDAVEDILGESISEGQRNELCDSLYFLLNKYSKEFSSSQNSKINENYSAIFPNNYPNFNPYSPINIILLPTPSSSLPFPSFGNIQPTFNTIPPQNPYQMQMMQPQPFMAPPNPYYYNQQPNPNPFSAQQTSESQSSSKKHHKDKSNKHHSKSKKSDKKQKKKSKKTEYFEYKEGSTDSLKGIIYHLTQKFGGNVSEKNVVIVTSSSKFSSNDPQNAVDLENTSTFFEALNRSRPNEWLKYDFKDLRVKPTFYTIRTGNSHGNMNNPKNWVVEGSNDDDIWKVLDRRENAIVFTNSRIYTFNIQEKLDKKECFRYLRIRSTGKDTHNDNIFSMSALEYFGYIFNQ